MNLRNRKCKRGALLSKNILAQSFQGGACGCQGNRESGRMVTQLTAGGDLDSAGLSRVWLVLVGKQERGHWPVQTESPFDGEPDMSCGICGA